MRATRSRVNIAACFRTWCFGGHLSQGPDDKCPKKRSFCAQRSFVAISNALGSPYFNWSVRFQGWISDSPLRRTREGESLRFRDTQGRGHRGAGDRGTCWRQGLREVLVGQPALLLSCQLTAGIKQDSDGICVCSGSRDHAVSAAVELSLCLYLFRKEILHYF